MNLITHKEFNDLAELNTVRNRCSHTWLFEQDNTKKDQAFETEKATSTVQRHRSVPDRCVPEFRRAFHQALLAAVAAPHLAKRKEKPT
jgi:hypothetical protein